MDTTCPTCGYHFAERRLTHCPSCGAPRPATTGALAAHKGLRAGAWRDLRRLCGWCGSATHDLRKPDCLACGGPLPPVPPRILAEAALPAPEAAPPPPTPRRLPNGYENRVRIWKNVEVLIGLMFTVVFCWSVIFPLIGVFLLRHGWMRASRQLDALKTGVAVEGTITSVRLNRNKHINHEHPWALEYRFEAADGPRTGEVESWDPFTGERQPGERVWVVHDPADPAESSLWPPIR